MTHSPDLEALIARHPLPSLPAVALEVIEHSQRPDLDIEDLAATITNDPALAAKILGAANSSYYAQSRTISTVSQAIVLLGLDNLKALALSFSLVDGLATASATDFDRQEFWRHSLTTGAASRLIARHLGTHDAEEAFIGGLLSRIGVLQLSVMVADQHGPLAGEAGHDYDRLRGLEAAELGFTHADVGTSLAELWRLPASLGAAMRHVNDPKAAPEDCRPFVSIVAAAGSAAEVLSDEAGEALHRYRDRCGQLLGLSEPVADSLLAEIAGASGDVLQLFNLPHTSLPPVAEILGRANQALARLNFEMSNERVRLETENRVLGEQATTDPLTGLANRRHLIEFTHEQVELAGRNRSPLSLLFIDLDRLKLVNDRFGHQAGDEVLQAIGVTLQHAARPLDLAARYAGDEFVVVMPDTPPDDARSLANTICATVKGAEFTIEDGRSFSVTVSVGVASLTGANDNPDSLLGRADRAVYRAKEAGRNQVATSGPRRTA